MKDSGDDLSPECIIPGVSHPRVQLSEVGIILEVKYAGMINPVLKHPG